MSKCPKDAKQLKEVEQAKKLSASVTEISADLEEVKASKEAEKSKERWRKQLEKKQLTLKPSERKSCCHRSLTSLHCVRLFECLRLNWAP